MKNIFKIYKRDLKTFCTNWAARLMVIVLILIPSLYSLINIKASWDPYSNTSAISIAVVNKDKGTIFKEQDINVGEELIDKLKDNDKMGWQFVDEEEGKNGILKEKYYAMIVIPETFSKDVTTVAEKSVVKPKLIYTVNEKKNSIAPKLTDAGVKSVKNQLDDNIVKTISGILFRICDETGVEIDKKRPDLRKIIDEIYELDEQMPELEALLNDTINGTAEITDLLNKTNEVVPNVSNTIELTSDFLDNSNDYIDRAQGDLSEISPLIREDLGVSENLLGNVSVELGNLDENILPETTKKTLLITLDTEKATQKTVEEVRSKLKDVKTFLKKLIDYKMPKFKIDKEDEKLAEIQKEYKKQGKILDEMKDSLKKINASIDIILDKFDKIDEKLDILIRKTNEEISKLDNGEKLDIQSLKIIKESVDELHSQISDIIDFYDSELVVNIENGFEDIRYLTSISLDVLYQAKDTLPAIEEIISSSLGATDLAKEELVNLQEKFPEGKDKVHEIADKLREMDEDDKFDEILDMITNDWDIQSEFLSSPVEIEDNRLFGIPNYGSASAPFYTILCLWVGALIGSALLKLEAEPEEEGVEYKSYEVYLGKLLTFLTIGVCQALVASLGLIYGLKAYVLHPVMFVFYSVFVSFVFMILVYTAGSLLDDVGKALIVVMLVFQLAGTGGTFPIEVVPEMFQKIYKYFPFTYATNGMRQLVAGIVYPLLIRDIKYLCMYMIVSLILGLTLKGVLNKITSPIFKKLYSSGILRH